MSEPSDGGPAFPHDLEKHEGLLTTRFHGMSLRDYFAAAALTGFLASRSSGQPVANIADSEVPLTVHAYRLADAMLKARKLGGGGVKSELYTLRGSVK